MALASWASACPFCVALKPTLTQRREAAAVAVLGEFTERDGKQAVFRLHQFLQGESLFREAMPTGDKKSGGAGEHLRIAMEAEFKPGALVLLLGESRGTEEALPETTAKKAAEEKTPEKAPRSKAAPQPGQLSWSHVGVTELSFAYVARAPSSRKDSAERLRYFAPYLEHDDPLIAEDAYQEFGHAPFDKVAEVADVFDHGKLRGWLADEHVRDYRKGFYGVALGFAKSAAL